MKIKKILCIALSIILVSVCMLPYSYAENETVDAEYAEGQLLFKYEPPLTVSSFFQSASYNILDKLEDLGVTNIEELYDGEEETLFTASLYSSPALDEGVYVADIDGDVLETCRKLEKVNGIVYAEPNYIMHIDSFSMPTDINTSLYKTYSKWYFDYMHITEAWREFETAGENVLVAVIDNGFLTTTSEFPTHLWNDGNGHHGYNGYNNNYDISPVKDADGNYLNDSFHGSHVAGVIGMAANGSSFVGAAYKSELMLLKCANYIQGYTSSYITVDSVVNCINFASSHGADIITMSLSGTGNSSTLRNAITSAYNNNIAVFAAVGNNALSTNENLFYPASYSNVIGVMAIDKTNTSTLSDFSNYDVSGNHQYYDVAAPGCVIVGCGVDKTYVGANGTSQATPLVAACAALYLSAYPGTSVAKLYEAIRNSPTKYVQTNPDVTSSTYKFKALDAYNLLEYGKVTPNIIPNSNTAVTVDKNKKLIYGLDEDFEDIASYVTVENGTGTAELTPSENGNGTGSIYTVYTPKGEVFDTYTVLIYGDINGDCHADGQDAVLIASMIEFPEAFSEIQKTAANVDFDLSVTETDYSIVANYAIGLDIVTQS